MTSNQRFPRTVSKKLHEANKKIDTFSRDVFDRFSINAIYQGLVIMLVLISYSKGST